MKKLVLLLLMVCPLAGFAQSFVYKTDFSQILERSKKPADRLAYGKLLGRFLRGDSSLTNYEVLALMIGFTARPAYKPYDDCNTENAINRLNASGRYREALGRAGVFLKTHPLSLAALFEKAYAFKKLNQPDSAAVYQWRGTRLLNAMYFSGDGKTPETAVFALGPADGQDFITRFFGGSIVSLKAGKDADGNFLDIIEAKLKDGKTASFHFNIQHARARFTAAPGSNKP